MHWATSFLASSQFGVQASLFRNSSKLRSAKTEDLRHWHGFPSQAAGRSQSFRTIAFREAGPGNCQQSLPCTGQAFEMRRRSTQQPRQSQRTTGAPTTTPSIGPGTGPPTSSEMPMTLPLKSIWFRASSLLSCFVIAPRKSVIHPSPRRRWH